MVVGDIIVDEFIWGKASRISPEAPVPVINVTSKNLRLGGATNVVNNIHALGGRVSICGVVGNDEAGEWVANVFKNMGVETDGVVVEERRPTTLKTRVIAHNQQVLRYDQETKKSISSRSFKKMILHIQGQLEDIDGIIVSDYGKGVISDKFLSELLRLTAQSEKITSIDPKIDNFPFYQNVTLVTPNLYEASEMAGREILTKDDLVRVGKKLLKSLRSNVVLITQGEAGMTLFEKKGEITHIPTMAQKVYDVTGAGDTVIASLTLGLTVGASPVEAALISNHAAGVVVGEVGTCALSPEDLERTIRDEGVNRQT